MSCGPRQHHPQLRRGDGRLTTQTHLLQLVHYAAHNADVATDKRDAAIREAHRAGASLRDIAAQSGISHMSVKRIVERSGG